jgi:hypothetical protein
MPKSLRILDAAGNAFDRELLATNECNLEGQIGTAVFPAVVAIGGEQGDAQRSELEVLMDGPVIAKVRVTYEVDYTCPSPQTLSGEAIFTIFPTGRIVRQDHNIQPVTTAITAPVNTQCGCNPDAQSFFFTTFWSFDAAGLIDHVDETGNPTTGDVFRACSIYDDHGIAVAWSGNDTRIGVNGVASHVLDLIPRGSPTIEPTVVEDVFSAIQVVPQDPGGTGECPNILQALADDPDLDVGGVVLDTAGIDGIYRDEGFHDTTFDLTAPDGDVPAGFAVSINLDGATHAELTRDPPTDRVAFIQRDPDDANRFIFAFPQGLGSGERVTITPIF